MTLANFRLLTAAFIALMAGGCVSIPTSHSPTASRNGMRASGSTAGSTADDAARHLERCDRPLGTLSLLEEQPEPGPGYRRHGSQAEQENLYRQWQSKYALPILKLVAQQSNCFVMVERGRAMDGMMRERDLADAGELRPGSNMGKGQMVAADFTLATDITVMDRDSGGVHAGLAAMSGIIGGSISFQEAATVMTLVDNRSGVQLAAANGSSRGKRFDAGAAGWTGILLGAGGYSNTTMAETLANAYVDAYNNLARALKQYRPQEVPGGLGTGGNLPVQGASQPASSNGPGIK